MKTLTEMLDEIGKEAESAEYKKRLEIIEEVTRAFVEHCESHPLDSMLRDRTQESVVRWAANKALEAESANRESLTKVLPFEKWVEEAKRIVGEAMGYASMCWTPKPTGVFDSTMCGTELDLVIERLLAHLDLTLSDEGESSKILGGTDRIPMPEADAEYARQDGFWFQEMKREYKLRREKEEWIKELEAEDAKMVARLHRQSGVIAILEKEIEELKARIEEGK